MLPGNAMSDSRVSKDDIKAESLIRIQNPIVKSFLAGSLSGTLSTLILQPLDLLKTRIQSSRSSPSQRGITLIFADIYRNHGVFGLWKGLTPSLARTVPGVGLYFCCLHNLQGQLKWSNPSPLQAITLGITSRSFVGVILLPLTVIKTRFESTVYKYRSVTGAFKEIYIKEGYKGLFSGFSATLLRDAPFSGIYFMFYSQSKKFIPQETMSPAVMPTINFCRGLAAGLLAAVITQPFDTTKTHMQLNPKKHNSFTSTVQHLVSHGGVRSLYTGMLPRCLRRTLMSALSWTVFEQMSLKLGLE
ncbi:mitochondrial glycine transporter B-like [Apostichopus japonicus]|uniref:mitochondrial glycine transporter B-like n=1 Tax=Stichopus japonicus TaxID=307972 RepID=UPI003AB6974D